MTGAALRSTRAALAGSLVEDDGGVMNDEDSGFLAAGVSFEELSERPSSLRDDPELWVENFSRALNGAIEGPLR